MLPDPVLPPLETLLASGGDGRISPDAQGRNKYGCLATPQPDVLSYGSSTASSISGAGYAAAAALHKELASEARREPAYIIYGREMGRIRSELSELCDCNCVPGTDIVFGASGTDLHLFAAQLCAASKPLVAIMPEASETGTGVKAALEGRHFSTRTALGGNVTTGERIAGSEEAEVISIRSRLPDGTLRDGNAVEGEVEALAAQAATSGRHVLLMLTDVSKTGLIIPGVACAIALKRRYPETLDVLVDACQFRISPVTLRAYLESGFMIAMTGSKCVTGPAFCAAMLIPHSVAQRLRDAVLPPGLDAYSCQADWPASWNARKSLPPAANYGLLLRFEAALAELRAFHSLPQEHILPFVQRFARAVQERLQNDPALAPLASRPLCRAPLATVATWDHIPTIFPFLLCAPSTGIPFSREQTRHIYTHMQQNFGAHPAIPPAMRPLAALRCLPGQPVACGKQGGIETSALRLSLDMRLMADALARNGRGENRVIEDALRVLDKAALLARYLS